MLWDRKTAPAPAVAFLKSIERFRAVSYNDGYGWWSIGYGARKGIDGKAVTAKTPPITEAQAEQMVARDVGKAVREVANAVRVDLTDYQAGALVLADYNLGDLAVAAKSLLALVNDRQWRAAAERLKVYRMSSGQVSLGLVRRRWCEASIFLGAEPTIVWAEAERLIRTADQWPPLREAAVTN